MGEAHVNFYKMKVLISQDLGLQWSLGIYSGSNLTGRWTSSCQNSVLRKKKVKKEVKSMSFPMSDLLTFKSKVVRYLITQLPLFLSKVVQFCYLANKA